MDRAIAEMEFSVPNRLRSSWWREGFEERTPRWWLAVIEPNSSVLGAMKAGASSNVDHGSAVSLGLANPRTYVPEWDGALPTSSEALRHRVRTKSEFHHELHKGAELRCRDSRCSHRPRMKFAKLVQMVEHAHSSGARVLYV